jgi:predicted Fe-Mo cluster-binding NifX family protein
MLEQPDTSTRRAAFSAWGGRIAPVFEVAQELLLVDADAARVLRETRETLRADLPAKAVLQLVDLSVGMLVCGAISRPMLAIVEAYGIEVRAFLAGDLRAVVKAWVVGRLDRSVFGMPGCGCGRRASHHYRRKRR